MRSGLWAEALAPGASGIRGRTVKETFLVVLGTASSIAAELRQGLVEGQEGQFLGECPRPGLIDCDREPGVPISRAPVRADLVAAGDLDRVQPFQNQPRE